jgi:hypothetical protein
MKATYLKKLHKEIGVTTERNKWVNWAKSKGKLYFDYTHTLDDVMVTDSFAIDILRRVYACNASSKLLKLKCMNKIIELGGRLF